MDALAPHVGVFKIGLELFIAAGPRVVTASVARRPTVLDLKLHDIPETVDRAVARAVDLGVMGVTLHVQQQAALEKAAKRVEGTNTKLLAVTLLTSMDRNDMRDLAFHACEPEDRVNNLARFAYACGISGFVCSPKEVAMVRLRAPDAFLMVPGIRPEGTAAGDQKRAGTPAQAILDGADLLVVGRPIRDADSPAQAALEIVSEIDTALLAKRCLSPT